ncbi:MAG: protein-glutamate O-methyltransferase CheR [Syntrophobacteraceae bacterium]|jgi:chemotaxis protein methyltransferase CheR
MEGEKTEAIEIDLLLEAIHRRYGHDFKGYSRSHIIRRVKSFLAKSGQDSVAELIPKVLRDEAFFEMLVFELSVTVTQMFRDPSVFKSIRTKVVPILRTYPFLRVWVAGCATGEEAYSMAILLKEEGLYDHSTIFATDFNDTALEKARDGIYDLGQIRQSTENYQRSGGPKSFSEYYHAEFGAAKLDQSLKNKLVFANHNLATDSVFSEMHLILCRNVMIYFDRELQDRVFGLFSDSLVRGGFLCIGTSEEVQFSNFRKDFSRTDYESRIFARTSI